MYQNSKKNTENPALLSKLHDISKATQKLTDAMQNYYDSKGHLPIHSIVFDLEKIDHDISVLIFDCRKSF